MLCAVLGARGCFGGPALPAAAFPAAALEAAALGAAAAFSAAALPCTHNQTQQQQAGWPQLHSLAVQHAQQRVANGQHTFALGAGEFSGS